MSPAPPKDKDKDKPSAEAPPGGDGNSPKWLSEISGPAAAVAVLTGALGALAVTGVVERVQREHPTAILIAVIFVLVAGLLVALRSLIDPRKPATTEPKSKPKVPPQPQPQPPPKPPISTRFIQGTRRVLPFVALLLLTAGLAIGLITVVRAQDESPRPRIDASLKTQDGVRIVEATIKIGGVRSDDHVRIELEGLGWARDEQGIPVAPLTRASRAILYEAWVGGDSSGAVEHKVSVPLSSAARGEDIDQVGIRAWVVPSLPQACEGAASSVECRQYFGRSCASLAKDFATGCVILRVPRTATGPQLSATWSDADRTAVIDIKADGVPVEAGVVNAFVYRGTTVLSSVQLRPNSQGLVSSTIHVPIGKKTGATCVVAAIDRKTTAVPAAMPCPPDDPHLASWLRLPSPPVAPASGS